MVQLKIVIVLRKVFLSVHLLLSFSSVVDAGCFESGFCCIGRNLSCHGSNSKTQNRYNNPERSWRLQTSPRLELSKGYQLGEFFESLLHAQKLAQLKAAPDHDIPYNEEFVLVLPDAVRPFPADLKQAEALSSDENYELASEVELLENDQEISSKSAESKSSKSLVNQHIASRLQATLPLDAVNNVTFIDRNGNKISAIDLITLYNQHAVVVGNSRRKLRDAVTALRRHQARNNDPRNQLLVPAIRYVVLNDYVFPANVEKTGKIQATATTLAKDNDAKCYCDEICRTLNDCCNDYQQLCPVVDCQLSEWSGWTECEPITKDTRNAIGHDQRALRSQASTCDLGVSRRFRQVIREPEHGGLKCKHTMEQKACYFAAQQCRWPMSDVALLLNYELSAVRVQDSRPGLLTNYCVTFKVIYFNNACRETVIRNELAPGAMLCMECQPTAQNSVDNRCFGDGVGGKPTFWSFVHVKHCNGQWQRQAVKSNCSCKRQFADKTAFIFV